MKIVGINPLEFVLLDQTEYKTSNSNMKCQFKIRTKLVRVLSRSFSLIPFLKWYISLSTSTLCYCTLSIRLSATVSLQPSGPSTIPLLAPAPYWTRVHATTTIGDENCQDKSCIVPSQFLHLTHSNSYFQTKRHNDIKSKCGISNSKSEHNRFGCYPDRFRLPHISLGCPYLKKGTSHFQVPIVLLLYLIHLTFSHNLSPTFGLIQHARPCHNHQSLIPYQSFHMYPDCFQSNA